MKKSIVYSLLILIVGFSLIANAEDKKPNKKEENKKEKQARVIIDKMLDNIGGVQALKEVKSMHITGENNIVDPSRGFTEKYAVWWKAPDLFYAEFYYAKLVKSAYDGKTAWAVNPYMGAEIPIVISRKDQIFIKTIMNIVMPKVYNYKANELKVRFEDDYELKNGKDYNKIKVTNIDKSQEDFYFDVTTNLLYKREFDELKGEDARVSIELFYENWQKVNGIDIPKLVIRKENGIEMIRYNFDMVELNTKIDVSKFAYPSKDTTNFRGNQ